MEGRAFLFSALVLSLSGCATVFSPSTDNVTIRSNPPGATVFLDGMRVGKTPATFPVSRGIAPPQIEVKAPGYANQPVIMQNKFNAVSLLNIFFWPGFLVDVATDSMRKPVRTNFNVELEPAAPVITQPAISAAQL